jgi:hypothetical protein
MTLRAQNMKTGANALGTAKNEYGRTKHENWKLMPSIPRETSPGAQNMKMGPDDLRTVENVSGSENLKMGPYALGSVENESGSAKHENGTRRPRNRRKRVRMRKI